MHELQKIIFMAKDPKGKVVKLWLTREVLDGFRSKAKTYHVARKKKLGARG